MDTITPRQSLILYLRYREDWSLRRISRRMGIPYSTVQWNHSRALTLLANKAEEEGLANTPYIEGCLSLWCETGQRQTPRITALCEEQLAQDLESRMARRANELSDLDECMGANCSPPHKRSKGHAWTAWELAYLNRTGNLSVPTSQYKAGNAGRSGHCPCSKVVYRHALRK